MTYCTASCGSATVTDAPVAAEAAASAANSSADELSWTSKTNICSVAEPATTTEVLAQAHRTGAPHESSAEARQAMYAKWQQSGVSNAAPRRSHAPAVGMAKLLARILLVALSLRLVLAIIYGAAGRGARTPRMTPTPVVRAAHRNHAHRIQAWPPSPPQPPLMPPPPPLPALPTCPPPRHTNRTSKCLLLEQSAWSETHSNRTDESYDMLCPRCRHASALTNNATAAFAHKRVVKADIAIHADKNIST